MHIHINVHIMAEESEKSLPDEISRCLRLFKNASSDNERLASLMLVAKISKSSNIVKPLARKRIYDSIGFNFVNRLLMTGSTVRGEGACDEMLHHVAVAVLACYCTDSQLVLHPQVTSKIVHFNQFISSPVSAHVLVEDCLQCFMCLVQSEKGAEYLWKYHSLSSLFECYVTHRDDQELTRNVLCQFLSHRDITSDYSDQLVRSLTELSAQFKETHDEVKFDICHLLMDVVSFDLPEISKSNLWLSNTRKGLCDILQSKLDAERKGKALLLSGVLCQQYGSQWALPSSDDKSTSFVLLLVHLASIEVHLLLKDFYTQPPLTIIASFSILESVIVLMANQESEPVNKIDEETLLQLHTTLMECLSFLVQSLKTHQEEKNHADDTNPPQLEYLKAAIRLLGAWLAEDSLSLSSEVYSLLPFLLSLCESVEDDVLKFLLPGFSNLVTDDKPRRLLIENGLLFVLLKHVQYHMKRVPFCEDAQTQVVSCCSVLLTLLLSDSHLLTLNHSSSHLTPDWLSVLATIITENSGIATLLIHSSLLFLILLRRNNPSTIVCSHRNVITSIVEILSGSLVLIQNDPGTWESVSELWYISMQELRNLAIISCDVKKQLLSELCSFTSFMESSQGNISKEHRDVSSSIALLHQASSE